MNLKDKWINDHFELYWDELYCYSCNIVRDRQLAEDVVQEVFVQIWNNFHQLSILDAKSYLMRSVRNRSILALKTVDFDTIQLETVYHTLTQNENLSEEEQGYYKEELVHLIFAKAKEVLPKRCLEVFQLRYGSHLSYKQIAEQLSISESTVDKQIHKAIKSLKTNLPYAIDVMTVLVFLSL
ncbi:sigma-70 family RNA polymerase sigma factor [Myroides fluvii]|uniref:sigma-70 family RNA polymerase sigma factor n=1 Tax=Myroides fluvii TaxID=2572594 RepID=UPI00131EB2D7|nr:sigma-70 family RNA polymerase sigma factor [Myroides fluvii]